MSGSWLLLALAFALTLTLTHIPGGRAQPEAAQQEEAMAGADRPGLDDLLRQAERLLFLREDLQRLQGNPGESPESPNLQPDWLSKRQHPGKREEEEEEGAEEEEEEDRGAVAPHKRQHPGRREEGAPPDRRWLESAVAKRQHPGRRLVDPKTHRSWEEEEETEEEEGDGGLLPEKRQHPGKRAPGVPCGPQGACGQAGLLLGLLDDLSRAQGAEERRPRPGRRVAWAREPLEG
ncbi:Prothyroliberin [Tupaia chinensis]|uniref:Pro-thyrotropin-releasing hormone n=1 Tax=Tupaia chinensis TaxID=246437 RepID=L9JDC1_TUPCH|nr:Prothyroliberin [Tupaia chinensis]